MFRKKIGDTFGLVNSFHLLMLSKFFMIIVFQFCENWQDVIHEFLLVSVIIDVFSQILKNPIKNPGKQK